MRGVSFLIPIRNGASTLGDTLASVEAQADGTPLEILVVDDRSTDGSADLVTALADHFPITLIRGEGRGAAAALNLGIRVAKYPIICQVDQDVVLEPGWMTRLVGALDDPDVAAAQGTFVTDPRASLFARTMNRDLEERYASVPRDTDHVCTGNTAYRTAALKRVGCFDEQLGYGYDNDISYRLRAAGHRLVFCPDARSVHRWRDGLAGYFRQQYGFGYGRLDLVAKHPRRVRGDAVSPTLMMLHPLVLLTALLTLGAAAVVEGGLASSLRWFGLALGLALVVERSLVGIRAALRFRDATPLLFPAVHLIRDLAWVSAILIWTIRRGGPERGRPADSMSPRRVRGPVSRARASGTRQTRREAAERTLVVIPALNEGANLPFVVREIRAWDPAIEILVVDDGSTDGTADVISRLAVRRLHLPWRMGIGAAMRIGLRYASRHGFTIVVRLDGDGQHRASEIDRLIEPLRSGTADVVLGCRSFGPRADQARLSRWVRRPLAYVLTLLTGRHITDPTCGFCAIGPAAIHLLAECHPTGYPEPELRMLLSRSALTTVEVAVTAGSRLSGKTTLTPGRVAGAAWRVMLAICMLRLRPRVGAGA